jgi:hypothetical protein
MSSTEAADTLAPSSAALVAPGPLAPRQRTVSGAAAAGSTTASRPAAPADAMVGAFEVALAMAQEALAVRRAALDTLLAEVAALRRENDLLAASIVDPGLSALRERVRELEVRVDLVSPLKNRRGSCVLYSPGPMRGA